MRAQIEAQRDQTPDGNRAVTFTTLDGRKGRVWLASDSKGEKLTGDDRHWRLGVTKTIELAEEAAKGREAKRSKVSTPITLMGPVSTRKTSHGRLARGYE